MPTRNKMTTPTTRRLAAALLASTTLLAPAGPTDAASIYFTYGTGYGYGLAKLGTVTGRAKVITDLLAVSPENLAVDPDGTIYAAGYLSGSRRLVKLDPATGQATTVGTVPLTVQRLEIRPDGAMYGAGYDSSLGKEVLHKIDKATGAVTATLTSWNPTSLLDLGARAPWRAAPA